MDTRKQWKRRNGQFKKWTVSLSGLIGSLPLDKRVAACDTSCRGMHSSLELSSTSRDVCPFAFRYVLFLAVSPAGNIKANRRNAISVRSRVRAATVTAVAIPTIASQRIHPCRRLAKGLSINRHDLMRETCSLLLYIQLARVSQILRLSLSWRCVALWHRYATLRRDHLDALCPTTPRFWYY